MSSITQKQRLLSLKTPLAEDLLCINSATINERVSGLFSMSFEMITETTKASDAKYDKLLGESMTLSVELDGGKKRYFNGVVSRFGQVDQDSRFSTFRAEVVPWLWLLTLSSDCKVFQDETVPDIIEKIFKEWQGKFPSLVKFENKLSGNYTKVDYCVQYRETDFNFVSRLMEQEGIFYYFKHKNEEHTLVLGDSSSAFSAVEHQAQAPFLSLAGEQGDGVTDWDFRHSIVPGKYVLSDYHFQMSNKSIRPSADGPVKVASNDKLEHYDVAEFAERFNKPDARLDKVEKHGDEVAKWRAEEQAAGHVLISGSSSCRAFSTGAFFTLHGNKNEQIKVPGTDGKYVLASLTHTLQQSPGYVSETSPGRPYRNSFTCVPHDGTHRPQRVTPRPAVQGMQTAIVVGLKDEEIDCDKYGRVKVQFHWDREGKKDENSSCWVRVGTGMAGKEWGMIHIPRIGQEVIVAFLEGDPDQPIIVGSVYNYDNMPPYKLPDNKTQSGIKTRSTKSGNKDTFNELRFEDKKGKEYIYMHAERNMVRAVENFDLTKVGNPKIDVDPIAGSQAIAVRDIQHTMVGFADQEGLPPPNGNQFLDVWNNQTVTIGYGEAQAGDGSQTLEIYKDRTATLQMGNDSLQLKMGNQTTKLDLGKSETEAMQSIEFKVGQSSIKIDQMGVTIKGMIIQVEGQLMTNVKGLMNQVRGDAILQVGGGIMMLG